jgi:ATP-dependent Lon protease
MPTARPACWRKGAARADRRRHSATVHARARAPGLQEVARRRRSSALMRAVLALFEKVVHLNRAMPEDAYVFAMNIDEPGWLADLVASTLDLDLATRQAILETADPVVRLQKITSALAKELDVLELEDRIHHQVQREVDHSQREYYLREQLKAIQKELGENDLRPRS